MKEGVCDAGRREHVFGEAERVEERQMCVCVCVRRLWGLVSVCALTVCKHNRAL